MALDAWVQGWAAATQMPGQAARMPRPGRLNCMSCQCSLLWSVEGAKGRERVQASSSTHHQLGTYRAQSGYKPSTRTTTFGFPFSLHATNSTCNCWLVCAETDHLPVGTALPCPGPFQGNWSYLVVATHSALCALLAGHGETPLVLVERLDRECAKGLLNTVLFTNLVDVSHGIHKGVPVIQVLLCFALCGYIVSHRRGTTSEA